jgi:hypothetical protein
MRGVMKAEAESDIIAQEQALQTKVVQGKYLKQKYVTNADAVNYLMRVECIISACPLLAIKQ